MIIAITADISTFTSKFCHRKLQGTTIGYIGIINVSILTMLVLKVLLYNWKVEVVRLGHSQDLA